VSKRHQVSRGVAINQSVFMRRGSFYGAPRHCLDVCTMRLWLLLSWIRQRSYCMPSQHDYNIPAVTSYRDFGLRVYRPKNAD